MSTGYNSTYKKLAGQWLNEALCFVSSSVVADSFRLQNRQLLVAAKRYNQLPHSRKIKHKKSPDDNVGAFHFLYVLSELLTIFVLPLDHQLLHSQNRIHLIN